jgi:hypothetical protein
MVISQKFPPGVPNMKPTMIMKEAYQINAFGNLEGFVNVLAFFKSPAT